MPRNDDHGLGLNSRLFGSSRSDLETPLALPNAGGVQRSRDKFEHNPPGMVGPPPVSPADQARANALVQAMAQIARSMQLTASLPAHTTQMPWSNNLDLSTTLSLPAAAGNWITAVTYTAPEGRYGRLEQYGFDVAGGAFTYDGSILWRFTLNGNIPYDLSAFGEHRGSMTQPSDMFLIIPVGQTVNFQVQRAVTAGAASTIAMRMRGWDWKLRKNDEGSKASVTAS
jgi:hypothetical protein